MADVVRVKLALLFIFIVVLGAQAQTTDELVIPGKQVGRLVLETDLPQFEAVLGKADECRESEVRQIVEQETILTTACSWKAAEITTQFDRTTGLSILIRAWIGTGKPYRTAEGIKWGATQADVIRIYGQPTAAVSRERPAGGTYMWMNYRKTGVSFDVILAPNDRLHRRVVAIHISKPRGN